MNDRLDLLCALRMTSAIFSAIKEQQLFDVETFPVLFNNIHSLAEAGKFIADTALTK